MLSPDVMTLPRSPAGAVATHGDTGAVAGAWNIRAADDADGAGAVRAAVIEAAVGVFERDTVSDRG